MKTLVTSFLLCLFAVTVFAQSFNGINYQAVVTETGGSEVLSNQNIRMQFTILKGNINGTPAYVESHNGTTNSGGLINFVIGKGASSGSFSNIDWASDSYFLKVEIDRAGGFNYSHVGTSQFWAVPFALHAANVPSTIDTDPANEIQSLSINGNTLSIEGGNSITLPTSSTGGEDVTNELQTLSLNGATLSISQGNSVSLPVSLGDGNTSDELQSLSISGNMLSISDGNTVRLPEGTTQNLSINGSTLSISNGNSVVLPSSSGGSSLWNETTGGLYFEDGKIAIGSSSFLGNAKLTVDGQATFSRNNLEMVSILTELGGGQLFVNNSSGKTTTLLGSVEDNGALYLSAENGRPRFMLKATNNGGVISLSSEQEEPLYMVFSNDYGATSFFADRNGNIVNAIGSVNAQGGSFSNFNSSGKVTSVIGTLASGGGYFKNYNNSEIVTTLIDQDSRANGVILNYDSQGRYTAAIGTDSNEMGYVSIYGTNKTLKGHLGVFDSGAAHLSIYGANKSLNVALSSLSGHPSNGYVAVKNSAGETKVALYVNENGKGVIHCDELYVDGVAKSGSMGLKSANLSQYIEENPTANMLSLRGKSELKSGKVTVVFTEDFARNIDISTLTIVLTPKSAQSKGLAVTNESAMSFEVVELFEGTGSYVFDWEAKAKVTDWQLKSAEVKEMATPIVINAINKDDVSPTETNRIKPKIKMPILKY